MTDRTRHLHGSAGGTAIPVCPRAIAPLRLASPVRIALLVALALLASSSPAQRDATRPTTSGARFVYLDVHVDSGAQALAAYQIEVLSPGGRMNVVGIEGGEHPAFAEPPQHDRLEIIRNRVIIAAYSLSGSLPRGRTRVARIHVELSSAAGPEIQARLVVAGSPSASPIPSSVSITEGEAP